MNKKNKILLIIATITFLSMVIGATYAYFFMQGNHSGTIDTNIITGTTDLLSFNFGDSIYIQANQDNFGASMGNLSDSTTGTALLRAGDTTSSTSATYNIYLIIEENDFIYTTSDGKPEILLNVTDPNGNRVENITGLVHYEDGFDITTRTGGFLLVPDYEISATNTTETIHDWNIEVTLVNLDTDQQANTNKTLTGKLYITQDKMSSYELAEINNIESTTTYNSIRVTPDVTLGSGSIDKYYYGIEEVSNTRSIDTVEFIESSEANYEFTNLKSNTEYKVYSYVVDTNNIKSNVYETNVTTNEYVIPTIDNVTHSVTLDSITVNVTASGGSNNVTKYMYKINDNDWIETSNNTYTFTNLTDSTEYDIRIKVVDSNNRESTEYYEKITTEVYILPVVTSVNASTTWNSITLTPSGTNGTNNIVRYEYSINNGAYQTNNVFSNLAENTNYTIDVKAIDSDGRESNVYTLQVRTDTYALPTISISSSATTNSITVSINATPGDGSIVSYHYSRDNGSNYTTTSSNTHTFSGLTSGATYYLKVYVTDSNGRVSTVATRTQATTYVSPSVSNVTASNITSDSVTINVSASGGSNSISRYYYSSNNGSSWVNSTSSSYTFTNLSPGTQYTFRVYVTDTAGHQSNQKSVSATTSNPTLADTCTSGANLASCIKEFNSIAGDGVDGIYYHDEIGTFGAQEAGDNSYRFSGANPNNYVCFGSDAASCPADNLYRIIGVFGNQVKLIKATYASSSLLGTDGAYRSSYNYYWNYSIGFGSTNTWSESDLNTVNLNTNYLNNIGSTWTSKIATTSWKVGGNTDANIRYYPNGTPKNAYRNEIINPVESTTYSAKIGLMYVSDYYYGASPTYWRYPGYTNSSNPDGNGNSGSSYDYRAAKSSNWMNTGVSEWTITRLLDITFYAFFVYDIGCVGTFSVYGSYAVRPSFYLNSDVELESGTGTQTDPYRIKI